MSFAFNFSVGDDGASASSSSSSSAPPSSASSVHHTRQGERFHWHAPAAAQPSALFVPVALSAAGLAFEIVNASDKQFIARTGAISSILTTSDLQTGVYEGGFKLWECALDLVTFLAKDPRFQSFAGKRVAELGCGHALPGIYALQRGAAQVAFMDYNKEVLELTTCPNVWRNVQSDPALISNAAFYAGAWQSVSELPEMQDQHYDVLLTAETIYTEAVALELFQTIKRHLRRSRDAVALVAAKKYYFGTGGSVQHFVELVTSDATLTGRVVWEESDGRSNMRAIIEVAHAL